MGTVGDIKPEWVVECEKTFPGVVSKSRQIRGPEWEVFIEAGSHKIVLQFLKSRTVGAFEHLADLTAYDEHPASPRFHVVYELISMEQKLRARIIAICSKDQEPVVDSICDLWGGANWLEREVFDMFGIDFKGHPDLRRVLLPQNFAGHPLRKDFVVDYRQTFPASLVSETAFDPFGNTVVKGEGLE